MSDNAARNAQIIELRKQSVGPREISRRLSISPQVVSGVLFRAKLTRPIGGRGNGPSDEVKAAAAAMASRIGQIRTAKAFGVSQSTISNWTRLAA